MSAPDGAVPLAAPTGIRPAPSATRAAQRPSRPLSLAAGTADLTRPGQGMRHSGASPVPSPAAWSGHGTPNEASFTFLQVQCTSPRCFVAACRAPLSASVSPSAALSSAVSNNRRLFGPTLTPRYIAVFVAVAASVSICAQARVSRSLPLSHTRFRTLSVCLPSRPLFLLPLFLLSFCATTCPPTPRPHACRSRALAMAAAAPAAPCPVSRAGRVQAQTPVLSRGKAHKPPTYEWKRTSLDLQPTRAHTQ